MIFLSRYGPRNMLISNVTQEVHKEFISFLIDRDYSTKIDTNFFKNDDGAGCIVVILNDFCYISASITDFFKRRGHESCEANREIDWSKKQAGEL